MQRLPPAAAASSSRAPITAATRPRLVRQSGETLGDRVMSRFWRRASAKTKAASRIAKPPAASHSRQEVVGPLDAAQNGPTESQHRLKPTSRSAWTWIVTAKLLAKLLGSVDHAIAALNARLRRISAPALTARAESSPKSSKPSFFNRSDSSNGNATQKLSGSGSQDFWTPELPFCQRENAGASHYGGP